MIDFIFKRKYFISVLLLFLALILLFIGLFKLENDSLKPGIIEKSTEQDNWTKYTNKDFNFTISFPKGWKINEDYSNKDVPKINIYKEKYKINLPLDNFSADTNISIFPEGIPTDAVQGQTKDSSLPLSEKTHQVLDYLLMNGDIWASYITFDNVPKSWKKWGFIWVNNEIQNLKYRCFSGKIETDLDNCNTFEGDLLKRDGKIDQKIREEQIKILKTFKFIN